MRCSKLNPSLTTLALAHLPMHNPRHAHASVSAALTRTLDAGATAVMVLAVVDDDGTTSQEHQQGLMSALQQQLNSLLDGHHRRPSGGSGSSVNLVMVTPGMLENAGQLLKVLLLGRRGLPPLGSVLPGECPVSS